MPEWIAKYWMQWIFGLVIAALTAYCKHLSSIVKREKQEQRALREGVRSLLKRQIVMDCENAIKNGECPTTVKAMIEDSYNSYHGLGGNGTVTALYEQVISLPPVKTEV